MRNIALALLVFFGFSVSAIAESWSTSMCSPAQAQAELAAIANSLPGIGVALSLAPGSQGGVVVGSGGANGSYLSNIMADLKIIAWTQVDVATGLFSCAATEFANDVQGAACGSVNPAILNAILATVKPCCLNLAIIAAASGDHNAIVVFGPNGYPGGNPLSSAIGIIDGWWTPNQIPVLLNLQTPGFQSSPIYQYFAGSNPVVQTYSAITSYYSSLTQAACQPQVTASPLPISTTVAVPIPTTSPVTPTAHCSCNIRCSYSINSLWVDGYGLTQASCNNPGMASAEVQACGSYSIASQLGCNWVP